jgi:branched-chain amino acid transport system permease protein
LRVPDVLSTVAAAEPARERQGWQAFGRVLVPAALAAAAVIVGPWVLDAYTVNILIRAFFVATVAVTVDILWGFSGYLTFGQSAFFGIGVYVLAIAFTQLGFGPLEAFAALAATIVAAIAVAFFVGWLSFYSGSTPLYASVISLVLPIVLVQVLYSGGTFTGSSSGLVGFESFDLSIEAWFRIAGLAVVVTALLARIGLSSDAGRILNAMRDNDARCAYLGLDTSLVRIFLLVVCAVIAALAGFGYAAFGGVAAPENASFTFGTQLVVMVALGGRGTLIGAVVGALVIEVASAYLSGSLPFIWELIVGVAFILVIVLLPSGLFGGLRDLAALLLGNAGFARARSSRVELATREHNVAASNQNSPQATPEAALVVEAHEVSKHFGSLSVLTDVGLSARRGELISLVGPNGAGKTTLLRCLADGRERSSGSVKIAGRSIGRLPPNKIVALGLGRKFQAASVFETLSVADCLKIARARHERPRFIGTSRILALPPAARAVVETSGLGERLQDEARLLSHGLKQALELAMVLALEPEVILLDEPTAGLTRAERQRFAEILTGLVARDRLCVLIVEHDLDFVREISSRIIVLHQGRIALDGSVAEVVDSALVREIYSGKRVNGAVEKSA